MSGSLRTGLLAAPPLWVGNEIIGQMLTTPIAEHWGGVRIDDYALPQTAYALAQSQLWLPASPGPRELKMAPLGAVGTRGKYHLDFIGRAAPRPL